VKQFGDLERQLQAAKDSQGKSVLLTDDFKERRCAAPGTPVPRAQWLVKPSREATLSQEAVHSFEDVAIYSALQSSASGREMLVDSWKQQNGKWKLAVRYRCPSTGTRPRPADLPKRF
jgi:hypothetical protein